MSSILSKFGVTDPSTLKWTRESQIQAAQLQVQLGNAQERTLIYDGDGGCYAAVAKAAKIETAMRRFHADIEMHMELARCTKARVHLTPRGCLKNNRHLLRTVKGYQNNRVAKEKPPLLEVLRAQASTYFANHPYIQVFAHYDIEADDAVIIDAYSFKNSGVTSSPDKDMNLNPYESYIVSKGKFAKLAEGDTFGYLEFEEWSTPTGNPASKLSGKGTKFFWAQMLMGDPADNVSGIISFEGKPCGYKRTYPILQDIHTESDAANLVVDAYRKINQNVVAEGAAMWLLRDRDDSISNYLLGDCSLSADNVDFVRSCEETAYIVSDQAEPDYP